MNARYTVIDAPSILGLRPTGVQFLPKALRAAGIVERLEGESGSQVLSLPYDSKRNPITFLLNGESIRIFSHQLATVVSTVIQKNRYPLVLGGDCSILIGNMLALRRLGRYGLFFIDGHSDFYQPIASTTGEVADMDLAIVSGRGPDLLTNIDGLRPLVRDEDIILFGYRDRIESTMHGSQQVEDTPIHAFDLDFVRSNGIKNSTSVALDRINKSGLHGLWIHLDVDVLDSSIMPAVDYHLENGLTFKELAQMLDTLISTGITIGMDITIFNPKLDPSGVLARKLVGCVSKPLIKQPII